MQKSVVKKLKQALIDIGNLQNDASQKVTLALSVSDKRHRASVKFYRGDTFNDVWQSIATVLGATSNNSWVRLDIVQGVQVLARKLFEEKLFKITKMNFWRYGVSFDADFRTALLETEINGQAFFKPSKESRVGDGHANSWADYDRIADYLKTREPDLDVDIAQASHVWSFTTSGVFFDGQQIHTLETDGYLEKGIRKITNERETINQVISEGESYLMRQLDDAGKFIYGYFPALQRVLTSYNYLRHFSTVYALLEAAEQTKRSADFPRIKRALQWGIDHSLLKVDDAVYLSDKDELKLGSQAMLILALCKYQELSLDRTFAPVLQQAFNGIKKFWNSETGFIHVLNEDLTLKSGFRIIYYDGEAVFALCRLYELQPNDETKQLVREMLDRMVANDYGQFHDHWIAYAINEALSVFPDNQDYMKLGIKNVFTHFNYIKNRVHASPTLLELLDASQKMVDRIQRSGNDELLADYEVPVLHQLMHRRALYEIQAGAWLPEIAMYLYRPEKFVGGFYARDDNFRTRIDDSEHFLSGLVNYYNYTYRQA
ncbi:glycosyl transferase family 1 [Lactiplantibacillus pentosus]|jgi:hypothetical protein|uniref:glycosyl transferase family 1 n=1 Tax=Lactiplantibacillus pentosus TaxID=1589 RepID=UPI0021A25FFB|nr:glycosyl transferase family 1 [Lactiplantibacillus pentosus]MCT3285862.1 glycosyl transferase family 1 [Lactiplantibacillus pentosus]